MTVLKLKNLPSRAVLIPCQEAREGRKGKNNQAGTFFGSNNRRGKERVA
jgi:hypothetical protein